MSKGRIILFLVPCLCVVAVLPLEAKTLRDVFKQVHEAVVVVNTIHEEISPEAGDRSMVSTQGIGSGVLISESGLILTAAHVVQTADAIEVEFTTGERIPAEVVASAPTADVALLQVLLSPENVRPATLGSSETAEVGDQVFVVGAPLGVSHTLTVGHISAKRTLDSNNILNGIVAAELFQTDAAINPGNSGGPMFNMDGHVIGIVSHILTKTGGHQGLGFAVTSNTARKLLLERNAFWSGIEGFFLTGELADIFNLPQPEGILIQRVASGSPADRATLKGGTLKASIEGHSLLLGGDIILEALGMNITQKTLGTIIERASELQVGDEITITVVRGGQILNLDTSRLPAP